MADGRREEPDLNFLSSFPGAGNLLRRPGRDGRQEEGYLLSDSHRVLLRNFVFWVELDGILSFTS